MAMLTSVSFALLTIAFFGFHTFARANEFNPLFVSLRTDELSAHQIEQTPDSALNFSTSGEVRLRYNYFENGFLSRGDTYAEGLNRNVLGFQLSYTDVLQANVEFANGNVVGSDVSKHFANYKNKLVIQQAYLKTKLNLNAGALYVSYGRFEFKNAPKQLIAPGDGPNIRKSFNGTAIQFKNDNVVVEAFSMDNTKLDFDWFDDKRNSSKSVRGLLVNYPTINTADLEVSIMPLFIDTIDENFIVADIRGKDHRQTIGTKVIGKHGHVEFDWLLVKQIGNFNDRNVSAWGVFAQHYYSLPTAFFNPRFSFRLDLASGGNANTASEVGTFNQLHAASGYLSQGLFLSSANLLMVTPGISFFPSEKLKVSIDLGFAAKLDENDYAYAGLMMPYTETDAVAGKQIGQLFRLYVDWNINKQWTFFAGAEHFNAGKVLTKANIEDGNHFFSGLSYRFKL